MRVRHAAALLLLTVVAAACGSHPEQVVVDKYFGALNQGDHQTLGSFAAVDLGKKVDNWAITATSNETRSPAPLAQLVKKEKDLEAALAQGGKKFKDYKNEHAPEMEQLQKAQASKGKIPAKVQPMADWVENYRKEDRDLKKQLAEAKQAVEKERHSVRLSVGQVDDVDGLTGEVLERPVEMSLTIGGKPQAYVMTLRRYEVTGSGGAKIQSRWFVQGLAPKS